MKLAIMGSKNIYNPDIVIDAINEFKNIYPFAIESIIICGSSPVDYIIDNWAEINNIPISRSILPTIDDKLTIENIEYEILENNREYFRNIQVAQDSDMLLIISNGFDNFDRIVEIFSTYLKPVHIYRSLV